MRLFIAVELDDQVKDELNKIQSQVKRYADKGNFTRKDNYHITLHFIGDVDEEKIKELKNHINNAAANMEPFTLNLNKLGDFRKKQRSIVWAGVNGQLEALHTLKQKVEDAVEKAGFPREDREFNPHITLGRQVILKKSIEDIDSEIEMPDEKIDVKSLSLMESTRMEGKLVYKSIYEKKFE